jgi:hypothetical protein
MHQWLNIVEHRDFFDVPRIFIVSHNGTIYLFDCPFDNELDDFSGEYQVYEMGRSPLDSIPDDWSNITAVAKKHLGKVAVAAVRFDATRRHSICDEALKALID